MPFSFFMLNLEPTGTFITLRAHLGNCTRTTCHPRLPACGLLWRLSPPPPISTSPLLLGPSSGLNVGTSQHMVLLFFSSSILGGRFGGRNMVARGSCRDAGCEMTVCRDGGTRDNTNKHERRGRQAGRHMRIFSTPPHGPRLCHSGDRRQPQQTATISGANAQRYRAWRRAAFWRGAVA